MEQKAKRLYFIDAIRAWAILMMLQGHFVDGLLDPVFRDPSNIVYATWKYFRGITAPVFFTVSGFIFTYLLVKVPETGWDNPRVKKGIRRGLQLIFIGYLLRLNLFGLFKGQIYDSFYLVDVLHCIGLSILGITAAYLLGSRRQSWVFPGLLLGSALLLFVLEPWYKGLSYPFLPESLANYFSRANGSVFTIFPWFGYTAFGAVLSLAFTRFKNSKHLYPAAIVLSAGLGLLLIFQSSAFFATLADFTGLWIFEAITNNNYLFIRLGDVFVVFALFMLFRKWIQQPAFLKVGQNTLSIYVIHFVILYGSFTGLGLYHFFHHSLPAVWVISGAILFMGACSYAALAYDQHESSIMAALKDLQQYAEDGILFLSRAIRSLFYRLLRKIGLLES